MCHDTAREFFNAPAMASSDKKLEFDTLTYAGDNRWCDDWDYTCTVGVQVEETQEPAHHRNSVMKRRSSTTKPRASVSFTPDSTPRGGGAAAAAAVKEALGDMTEGPTKPVGRPAQLPVAGSGVRTRNSPSSPGQCASSVYGSSHAPTPTPSAPSPAPLRPGPPPARSTPTGLHTCRNPIIPRFEHFAPLPW